MAMEAKHQTVAALMDYAIPRVINAILNLLRALSMELELDTEWSCSWSQQNNHVRAHITR